MTLSFPGLSKQACEELEQEVLKCPQMANFVNFTVSRNPEGIVLKHDNGYVFFKNAWDPSAENDVQLFRSMLKNNVVWRYMPVVYEVTDDPTIPHKIVENFSEVYGATSAAKIQWISHRENDKSLLVLLIPEETVRAMMYQQGGQMITVFKGKAGNLREIKQLASQIPESHSDDDSIKRVFGCQYGPNNYWAANKIHWDLVRDVLERGKGIYLGPIGVWAP
jgi:hypothetical protein